MPTHKRADPSPSDEPAVFATALETPGDGCYHIFVKSELVRDDGAGGIVEAPHVLKHMAGVQERCSVLLRGKACVGPIVATSGQYAFLLSPEAIQRDLLCGAVIEILVPPMAHAAEQICQNAKSAAPATLAQLGISKEMVGLLQTLAQGVDCGWLVEYSEVGSRLAKGLLCPTMDELSSIASEPPNAQKINGRVTGIGTAQAGTRIEVNETTWGVVPGLHLEEAFGHLKSPTQVTAKLVHSGKNPILEDVEFVQVSGGLLEQKP